MTKIVLIGAGNVATHIGKALNAKGFDIVQVYNRTLATAQELSKRLQASATDSLPDLYTQADLYIFAVKDAALADLLPQMPTTTGIWVHTAGSLPMSVFEGSSSNYGVIYPLQTFSKERPVSFDHLPLFVEGNTARNEDFLADIAAVLSDTVMRLPSEKRQYLHLAAVFACNFVNHMYDIAAQILEKESLPYELLLPLIEETAAKIKTMPPRQAQTGPAVRYDDNIIRRHLELLKNDLNNQEIYSQISKNIHFFSYLCRLFYEK
ncbi:MAG: DUF2520 domain-containing protein [Candidatus Symbiothrix sp.]|jgi:predicted short-subunit dehydrogenase-like oxidoreductase (DUF2520 family)|nr:DUF2520 domain-containing protein [Candidatus Symbiothrix sp.]